MAAAEPIYDALKKVIKEVRTRITKHAGQNVNEAATKLACINPMLCALGWDVANPDEVAPEYCGKPGDNPVDYGLMTDEQAVAFVEAKRLQENVKQRKHVTQAVSYAGVCGVTWCVLTNGDEYRIYKSDLPVDAEEKLFRAVKLSDGEASDDIIATLRLLSRESLLSGEIDRVWRENHVDARVRETVERLFAEGDAQLAKIISNELDDLRSAEIQDALKRATVEVTLGERVAPPGPKVLLGPPEEPKANGPIGMTLAGEKFTCKYVYEIFTKTADWLVKQGKLSASDCPVELTEYYNVGTKHCNINSEPVHSGGKPFKRASQITGGLYVEANISGAKAERFARLLLERCGMKREDLEVDWGKQAAAGPITMTLKGEEFSCQYGNQVLITTADWLVRRGIIKASDCPIALTADAGDGRKRCHLNTEPVHIAGQSFIKPHQISGGLYVEADVSRADSEELSRRLLERCGMKREDLEVDWGK